MDITLQDNAASTAWGAEICFSRRYEELNDDHSKLDDIREWILGEQASDPRCAPEHRNTTLKVHVGPVSSHVANWEAVEETLRGTRYEHFLSE